MSLWLALRFPQLMIDAACRKQMLASADALKQLICRHGLTTNKTNPCYYHFVSHDVLRNL